MAKVSEFLATHAMKPKDEVEHLATEYGKLKKQRVFVPEKAKLVWPS